MKKTGDILWCIIILGISFLILSPATNPTYTNLNESNPYIMGFFKFAIMAMMGEMLAFRIIENRWSFVEGFFIKMLVWGVIGIIITFMFMLFPLGVQEMINNKIIPSGSGYLAKILFGFYTSIIANFAFGPIFMAAHRVSDTYIEMKLKNNNTTLNIAIDSINWPGFIKTVVGKMIPFFWLPAHIITFLLPPHYRILFAAYLSIILGILLALAKKEKNSVKQ